MTYKETAEKTLQQSGVAHAQLRAHYVAALESAGVLKEDETAMTEVLRATAEAAWDEGYEAGDSDEAFRSRGLPWDSDAAEHPHTNPYRTETQ